MLDVDLDIVEITTESNGPLAYHGLVDRSTDRAQIPADHKQKPAI